MTNASHDGNGIPTILAALDTNGATPIPVQVDPTDHGLMVNDGVTGTDHGTTNAERDSNRIPVLLAVSSSDGTSIVELYADSSGNLLINSQ